MALSYEFDKKS